MATYNGQKFIREQIDSLLKQTYQFFNIYIRDDGSSDDTLQIINEYVLRYPKKIFLVTDDTLHRGAMGSFLFLLKNVNAEYYMFCDQDDYWLENKIELSISSIRKLEDSHKGIPAMVHTDLRIVDKNLKTIYPSFWRWGKFNVDLNRKSLFVPFGNVFTGCTMIINDLLKEFIFPVPDFVEMHDEWIGLVAVKNGIIDNIKQPTILYRQHGNNVCSTGNKRKYSFKDIIKGNDWYSKKKPILDYLNYGPKVKAVIFKYIYSISRVFFHN